jgi:hypothetical protein
MKLGDSHDPGHRDPRNHKDLGAKRLLGALGPQLATFLTGRAETRFIRAETRELAIKQRTPDLELHLEDPELGKILAIVEIQTRPDIDLPRRLAALTTWLLHDRGCHVIPVVIYLGKPGEARRSDLDYALLGFRIEVRPIEIVLAELDARQVLENGMDGPWWPFLPFMKHGRDPEVFSRLMEQVVDRPHLRDIVDDMLRTAAYMVDLSQVKPLLEGIMFDKIWDMEPWEGSTMWKLRERWKQEAVNEAQPVWLAEGLVQGLEQGLDKGRAEGSHQEALRLARRAIARRFGMPDADVAAQLETLSTDQLEILIESLFDMKSREDLLAWLDRED